FVPGAPSATQNITTSTHSTGFLTYSCALVSLSGSVYNAARMTVARGTPITSAGNTVERRARPAARSTADDDEDAVMSSPRKTDSLITNRPVRRADDSDSAAAIEGRLRRERGRKSRQACIGNRKTRSQREAKFLRCQPNDLAMLAT